jgi:mono/diheme cytochrome c family protein
MPRTASTATNRPHRALVAVLTLLLALAAACTERLPLPTSAPERLADTGLYADFGSRTVADGVLPFTPQYPLWTDGATKRRWIALPPGAAIDASNVDDWVFPIGTRLWKEFAFGRAVETRFLLRRADGSWLYATYVWTPDGSDAVLAPETGVRGVIATADGQGHDVPSQLDCRLCHENGRSPVLGFGALQLSPDRDPLAPHATAPGPDEVDLRSLVARGLVVNLPAPWATTPPRIDATSAEERAALGYLHGNCSSCHNASGPLHRLGMRLDFPLAGSGQAPAITTTVGVASSFTRPGVTTRIAPGAPDHSVLVQRLRATDALVQMPPFGRHLADRAAVDLVERWVEGLASTSLSANVPHSSNTKE